MWAFIGLVVALAAVGFLLYVFVSFANGMSR